MSERNYRLSIGRLQFAKVELRADSPMMADIAARSVAVEWPEPPTESFVYRIEQRVPSPDKPGEFQWEEVKR